MARLRIRQVAGCVTLQAGIAHRAIRNRGTIGGSLAHADPAADWVIVMTGLGATIVVQRADGRAKSGNPRLYHGAFRDGARKRRTDSVRSGSSARQYGKMGVLEVCAPGGEFAKARATVLVDLENSTTRVCVGALGRQPLVLDETNSARLVGGRTSADEVLSAALPDRSAEDLALHIAALNKALAAAIGDDRAGGGSGT